MRTGNYRRLNCRTGLADRASDAARMFGRMDSYAALEVPPDASTAAIRAAYRRLAQQWHPDKNPMARGEATRRMAEINLAWEMLRSVETRRIVDEARRESARRAEEAPRGVRARGFDGKVPKLIEVESGCVRRYGHDGRSNLFLEFRTGGLYIYPGVSPVMYGALHRAKSKSRYVLSNIVNGPYTGKRIGA